MPSQHARRIVHARGWAAVPAAAVISLGAVVAPAVAQGHHHRRHHGAVASATTGTTRTVTIRGVVTAASDGTTLQIVRARDARRSCLTPKITTLALGPATTYTTPSTPDATGLAVGDTVTVTIAAPSGTDPTTVAATSVVDSGAAAPITCVVRGTATDPTTGGTVTITIPHSRGRHTRHHGHAAARGARRNTNLHRLFATAPASATTVTVAFGPGTTFVDIPNPTDTIDQIAAGDRLTVVWSLTPGTDPRTVSASEVVDHGPPPPIRYVARGTDATAPDTTALSFGLTVGRIRPNIAPALAAGTLLPVQYSSSTVFTDIPNPGDTIDQIAPGDRLVVVWSAPRGTRAANLPAAVRVIDLGPAGTPG